MPYKFSPSTKGFYIEGVHTTIPIDVVDVTDDRHLEVFGELNNGMVLGSDPKTGQPMAVPAVPFVVTWDMVRKKRDNIMDNTDWTQVPDNKLTDAEKQAWQAYRQKLRDLPDAYTDPTKVVWPIMPDGTVA